MPKLQLVNNCSENAVLTVRRGSTVSAEILFESNIIYPDRIYAANSNFFNGCEWLSQTQSESLRLTHCLRISLRQALMVTVLPPQSQQV